MRPMFIIKLLPFIFLISCGNAETGSTPEESTAALKKQLEEIWELDQKYRSVATRMRRENKGLRTQEEVELWEKQTILDTLNMIEVEKIISKYGYPSAELVGEELKSVCAFVIIHNPDKQAKYLDLLWKASDDGSVDKREVAILEDRVSMFEDRKQRFGTAMRYDTIGVNDTTGELITELKIWEIESFENLDKEREKVGWYSFKIQCDLQGFDWREFEGYIPQENKFDAPIEASLAKKMVL